MCQLCAEGVVVGIVRCVWTQCCTESSISVLLACLHGGCLYAKNQTDAPTVRLNSFFHRCPGFTVSCSSYFFKQWCHLWSPGGAAVLGVTYRCYIMAHFMCKNGLYSQKMSSRYSKMASQLFIKWVEYVRLPFSLLHFSWLYVLGSLLWFLIYTWIYVSEINWEEGHWASTFKSSHSQPSLHRFQHWISLGKSCILQEGEGLSGVILCP